MIRSIGTDVIVVCADITDPDTAATPGRIQQPRPGCRCAGCCMRRPSSATPPWSTPRGELIDRDWDAKVSGAWHLHQAVQEAGQPLDWFCCFSSAAALVGSPGQCAYAAANSWLDAFSEWRRAHHLPSIAIAWGPWAEIGAATAFAENTGQAISPDDGAYAFDTLLRYDRAYAAYAPVLGNEWLVDFARRSPFAEEFGSHRDRRRRHHRAPHRTRRAAPRGVAHPDPAADLRPSQRRPAPYRRPRPAAVRIRRRLSGRTRATYPNRIRNRHPTDGGRPRRRHRTGVGRTALREDSYRATYRPDQPKENRERPAQSCVRRTHPARRDRGAVVHPGRNPQLLAGLGRAHRDRRDRIRT